MVKEAYFYLEPCNKKKEIINLRYWIMHDLFFRNQGKISNHTNTMLKKLEEVPRCWYSDKEECCLNKEYIQRLFVETWNSINSTFLKQVGVDPLLMTHKGLL